VVDKKLSTLTELTTPADADEIYIRDVSELAVDESKRITFANLKIVAISGKVSVTKTLSGAADMANSPAIDTPTKAWT